MDTKQRADRYDMLDFYKAHNPTHNEFVEYGKLNHQHNIHKLNKWWELCARICEEVVDLCGGCGYDIDGEDCRCGWD